MMAYSTLSERLYWLFNPSAEVRHHVDTKDELGVDVRYVWVEVRSFLGGCQIVELMTKWGKYSGKYEEDWAAVADCDHKVFDEACRAAAFFTRQLQ